ncbi:MAG: glycoside hydrolase family 31 protein [Kineosporiaceae bacterium]
MITRGWFRKIALAGAAAVAAATTVVAVSSPAQGVTAGNATAVTQSGATFTVTTSTTAQFRVTFARADIMRLWLAPTGTFSDPAGTNLAVNTNFGAVTATLADAGTYFRISTSAMVLRINKSPLTFAAYRPDNTTLLWSESQPMNWTGTQTTQYLNRGSSEQFYGTGLRLGEWALRDKIVPVAVSNSWTENTNASPAPFYMSTNGYGVMRNTWSAGSYAFASPVATTHNENRFDAYFVVGDSLKGVLNAYTDLSGKPFLTPIWGLELGNADCWNASNPSYQGSHTRAGHLTTPDVVSYAQAARAADMPSGWFLPNDGYGCGYTNLTSVVSSLNALGFKTGLWTSTGLANIASEVGTSGSRGIKTDVAWVGGGYQNAFNGVNQAVAGIENNSDARRFVWTVDGWAGTQRNAIVWTGDTSGDWNTMRWTVPAVVGAGLSGFNYATGDVDGIFGGSATTYVRDLQWKSFTPALMTMSGWGPTNPSAGYQDKQPWRWSEPYLSINRKYLKLKMRLTPYHYTLSRIANQTGVPSTRALVLEYPNDPVAQGNTTSGEFMAGDAFLVAPVVTNTTTRSGIYLPAGAWRDYWTGVTYQGPTTLNNYSAPLDTLPLFVRAGSIVPMWPQMNYAGEKPISTLTYDVYPAGNSSFTLYEDDGLTRAYQTGAFATQAVNVTAPASGTGNVTVDVGASTGTFTGKQASRGYEVTMHVGSAPTSVTAGGATLTGLASKAAYDAASTGWFFDAADRQGVLWIKAGTQSGAFSVTANGVTVSGSGGGGTPTPTPTPSPSVSPSPSPSPSPSSSGGVISKAGWSVVSADSQETTSENGAASRAIDGNSTTIWHTKYSGGSVAPLPHEIVIDMGASYAVSGLRYLPRQDGGVNGRIGRYEVYVSPSTTSWGTAVATGTFADTAAEKSVSFAAKSGRYLRIRALSEAGNRGQWTSAAEFTALGQPG